MIIAITKKGTLVIVVKEILSSCANMAVSASTLHTIITIAPFSVINGNLYLTLHEQYFLDFIFGNGLLHVNNGVDSLAALMTTLKVL